MRKNKYKKGSYTVEAAFILPMILFSMIAVIYLSFFIHNKIILSKEAYISALRISQCMGKPTDREVEIEEQDAKVRVKNRILACDQVESNYSLNNKNIQISYHMIFRLAKGIIPVKVLNTDVWDFYVGKEVQVFQPVEFIRTCKKLGL